MDSQQHNGTWSQCHGTRRRARRGVSLIEVLVVLVILVVGILTIIRLFPSGFFSIQSTGNAGQADSLGHAAIDLGAQNAQNLPEAILPDNLMSDDLTSAMVNAAAYSNYDPDDPNNLENARVISNETITVPSSSGGRSIYTVHYGPIALGTQAAPQDPIHGTPTALSAYMTVNSPFWAIQTGDSVAAPNTKDLLILNRPNYLVDYTNGQIALPYADYSRGFVLTVVDANNIVHTLYLTVPKQHVVDATTGSTYQYGPITNDKLDFQVSEQDDYNGRWFDPADTTLKYATSQSALALPWRSVSLYRPYNWLQTGAAFSSDPYEFQLATGNIGLSYANPGAVAFNPLAGGATGFPVLKAQISYINVKWQILHEDYDIPALTGTGSTFVVRTSVPNLKKAGDANPNNTIYPGLAVGSNASLVILDLDSGKIVVPGTDPTLFNDEDLNGTVGSSPATINVSYSLGRITFGSDAFGDNSSTTPADGTGTAPAHRIRIFYTADLDWTVAVQKPSAYFLPVNTLSSPSETTPLAANQYVYDPSVPCVYVARCNAGKTFAIDGTATPSSGSAQTFSQTIAASPILVSLNAPDVQIPLPSAVTPGSAVTFSAVRGLSVRSVVAWKEHNQYKVHSVDAVLNRTP